MKTVRFTQPIRVSGTGFETDTIKYRFPFTIVDSSLIGLPEEKSHTSAHTITIGITWELRFNWRLREAPESDIVKILFEFAKRQLTQHIKKDSFNADAEFCLTTENAPDSCPFEVDRIANPDGATIEIEDSATQTPPLTKFAIAPSNSPLLKMNRYNQALRRAYHLTNGFPSRPIALETIAKEQGWNREELDDVYSYLTTQGLLKHFSSGGYIMVITHTGVVAAERLIEDEGITKKRQRRFHMLQKVYALTRQQGPTQIDLESLAAEQGLTGEQIEDVYFFLTGAEYVRVYGGGYNILMTSEHKLRVEDMMSANPAFEVFFSYCHKDEALRDELAKHLNLLKRQEIITDWHDRSIGAGQEWKDQIDAHLNSARVILLLVSVDFLASEYCWNAEMRRAMERHETGAARVIPIILRPCDWHTAPFGKLQALPKDAKPVTRWEDQDEALLDVTQGIRKAIAQLHVGS